MDLAYARGVGGADQPDETSYDWFSEVSLPLGLSSPSLLSESPFWNSDFATSAPPLIDGTERGADG